MWLGYVRAETTVYNGAWFGVVAGETTVRMLGLQYECLDYTTSYSSNQEVHVQTKFLFQNLMNTLMQPTVYRHSTLVQYRSQVR